MQRLFKFIDIYPDFATYFLILVSLILQVLIGNKTEVVITSLSLMLPTTITIIPINIVMKRLFKAKRPEQYYKNIRGKSIFEGSFPSFHAHLSAGGATACTLGIAIYSPESIRLISTVLAIVTAGFVSTLISYSRVALKMHYPLDVLGGFILGVITGLLIPLLLIPLWWKIPLIIHFTMIFVFAFLLYVISRRHRKIR